MSGLLLQGNIEAVLEMNGGQRNHRGEERPGVQPWYFRRHQVSEHMKKILRLLKHEEYEKYKITLLHFSQFPIGKDSIPYNFKYISVVKQC